MIFTSWVWLAGLSALFNHLDSGFLDFSFFFFGVGVTIVTIFDCIVFFTYCLWYFSAALFKYILHIVYPLIKYSYLPFCSRTLTLFLSISTDPKTFWFSFIAALNPHTYSYFYVCVFASVSISLCPSVGKEVTICHTVFVSTQVVLCPSITFCLCPSDRSRVQNIFPSNIFY